MSKKIFSANKRCWYNDSAMVLPPRAFPSASLTVPKWIKHDRKLKAVVPYLDPESVRKKDSFSCPIRSWKICLILLRWKPCKSSRLNSHFPRIYIQYCDIIRNRNFLQTIVLNLLNWFFLIVLYLISPQYYVIEFKFQNIY